MCQEERKMKASGTPGMELKPLYGDYRYSSNKKNFILYYKHLMVCYNVD